MALDAGPEKKINPQEQAPNLPPETQQEEHYHFKEVVPPEVENAAPEVVEAPKVKEVNTEVLEQQAPPVSESLVPEQVRDQKAEDDLFHHNSDLDPRSALENLLNK